VSHRVGTWSAFKESLLSRLSSSDYPALASLTTRGNDDFSIAFLDATAVMLDILTFYQERLANESYLRTATQLRSLTELSRLIAYMPAPGVAASTFLAFTLKAASGQPANPATAAITIPQGTQVQSVPAQGQTPQTFETSADILAKPDWNALPVQTTQPWLPNQGDTSLYLSGTATNLQPGDAILIVGEERIGNPTNNNWDVRILLTVTPDPNNNRTYIAWNEGLGAPNVSPAQIYPQVYALRQKAALFGYNAIDPNLLNTTNTNIAGKLNALVDYTVTLGGSISGTGAFTLVIAFLDDSGTRVYPSYDVTSDDTLTTIAAGISSSINSNQTLINSGITATSSGPAINVVSSSPASALNLQISQIGFGWGIVGSVTIQTSATNYVWQGFNLSTSIDLDAVYPKTVQNGWAVLVMPDNNAPEPSRSLPGYVTLYQILSVSSVSRSDFGQSAKISRIIPDNTAPLGDYELRETLALVQSEALAVIEQPLSYPLFGTLLDLADSRPDLNGATVVALSGTRQNIAITAAGAGLIFVPDDEPDQIKKLVPGDLLTLTDAQPLLALPVPTPNPITGQTPPWSSVSQSTISALNVEDANGRTGTISNVSLGQFILAPPNPNDPEVSEYALVSAVISVSAPYPHTQIQLTNPLANCFDRTTTTVNANVGPATAGQSVSEIMGSGSASTPNQSFQLKQSPLTFVQAPTPSGRLSTLQVQVNTTTWSEVPSLYNQGPTSQVFATLNQANSATEVIFGDGVEGALLPTGQNNLQANYRIGSRSAGNVGENSLTTLMDRPLGVSGVTNPEAATGGQDAQSLDDIRANAPLTVLTLGRAVSIADYQNYASAFAGIAKAFAIWVPSGPGRGVFLTVAGVNGAALPSGSATLANLLASLQAYGNPLIPITIASYVETLFQFSADLQYDPTYDQTAVQSQVFQTVYDAFSFATQAFGNGVSIDEVAALIQAVPGVVAVNVTALWRTTSSMGGDISSQENLTVAQRNSWLAAALSLPSLSADTPTQLYAYVPVANAESLPYPAEILVLDPGFTAASLGVMS
jgi:hypothetical protein